MDMTRQAATGSILGAEDFDPILENIEPIRATIGASNHMHPDFGSGIWPPQDGFPIGIPYNVVSGNQAKVSVTFYYPLESDPGP